MKNVTANRSLYLNISRIEKNTKELRDIEQKGKEENHIVKGNLQENDEEIKKLNEQYQRLWREQSWETWWQICNLKLQSQEQNDKPIIIATILQGIREKD